MDALDHSGDPFSFSLVNNRATLYATSENGPLMASPGFEGQGAVGGPGTVFEFGISWNETAAGLSIGVVILSNDLDFEDAGGAGAAGANFFVPLPVGDNAAVAADGIAPGCGEASICGYIGEWVEEAVPAVPEPTSAALLLAGLLIILLPWALFPLRAYSDKA